MALLKAFIKVIHCQEMNQTRRNGCNAVAMQNFMYVIEARKVDIITKVGNDLGVHY